MQSTNVRLDEAQAEIKISERNINNLRNVDDTTLMAGSKEELKSLLMKVKEESQKVGLKLTFRKLSSTLTSIHDYWKNHGFDQTDLCWQSNVSVF